MEFGLLVKDFRIKRGFKQKDFALQSGIPVTVLSKIENGKLRAGNSHLEKISKTLEIPIPVLMIFTLKKADIPANKRAYFIEILDKFKLEIKRIFFNSSVIN